MNLEASKQDRHLFRWSFLHPRYWLTWCGLATLFLVTLLPIACIDWLGCRLGTLAAMNNKKRFNIVKTNLSLCFADKENDEIEQMVRAHFQAQYRSLLHYFILWWRPISSVEKKIHRSGFEQVSHHRQQGKNIIIMLVHSVGLEFAAAAVAMTYRSNGPYKVMKNPVVDWLVANGRQRSGRAHGIKLFTRDDGLRPLIRETRAGRVLIYLADEDLGDKSSVFAPFFGVQKATIPVLGRLAASCNAVVLPCVSCYQADKKRYMVTLLPKIDGLTGYDVSDAGKMNTAIEQVVARCPVQYLWTLRYFKTRPSGERSVYE